MRARLGSGCSNYLTASTCSDNVIEKLTYIRDACCVEVLLTVLRFVIYPFNLKVSYWPKLLPWFLKHKSVSSTYASEKLTYNGF